MTVFEKERMQCDNKIPKSTAATQIENEVRNTLLPNGIIGTARHLGKNICFNVKTSHIIIFETPGDQCFKSSPAYNPLIKWQIHVFIVQV